MGNITDIPRPAVLDPHRPLRRHGTELFADNRPEAEVLRQALEDSCAYADQLWQTLNYLREYLMLSLPPESTATGAGRMGASPYGPDDDEGWQAWMQAFAATTSVLCGPNGDGGFGFSRARLEAQHRGFHPHSGQG
ncbi:hypothetical protein [Nakamurella multipartita]|jgi:hypothetical protein|uniref:Uncharacterized protein n=1 Tax=Nakamurella multipartita (strain ATCC 700099 / DSM 44233 / CIP 104796 / JCM 9543 / NBRC 105858 / Y-104) TaxID=479431 RepID=C8X636_NAKMY|nr:hypothetical protein [Nakamurella multipartita]ACV76807.1 hypothetical protein Namu_0380 [Nakamurella multipartita DSM 44233]